MGHEHWNQTVAVIADETEKQQMSMDLAIGPGWPIVSPLITDTDDEAAAVELTYGETVVPAGTYVERRLPERRVTHPEGNVKLVTVMAYEEHGEKCLDADSYLDLTPYVEMTEETEMLRYDFPENETAAETPEADSVSSLEDTYHSPDDGISSVNTESFPPKRDYHPR